MNKQKLWWCCIGFGCMWAGQLLPATTAAPTLVSLFSLRSQRSVYLPRQDYEAYSEAGGVVSGHKERRLFCQYGVVSDPAETERLVQDKVSLKSTTLMLRDGNRFLLPTAALTGGGIEPPKEPLGITARRLRPLVCLLLGVFGRVAAAASDEERLIAAREVIAQQRYTGTDIRDVEDAFYVLQGTGWLTALCKELNGDSDDSAEVSSVCTSDDGVTLFTGSLTQTSEGSFVRKNTVANLIYENHSLGHGMPVVQGALDLSGRGLTSIDDLGLLAQALPSEVVSEVTTIDLSHNDIIHVRGYAFTEFPFLKSINLSHNACLKDIDRDAFAGLPRLQVLDLSYGDLSVMPEEMLLNCSELHTVLFNNNRLVRLPALPRENNLRTLAAQRNELVSAPDMSSAYMLTCLNLAHNNLTMAHAHLLPNPHAGTQPALVAALFEHNNIVKIGSGFLARLPRKGIVDVSFNPVWHDEHIATTNELLQTSGYEHLSAHANKQGNAIANQVRDALFTDVREKLFDYLVAHRLVTTGVIKNEVMAKRALANISTTAADVGMWFYRYGGWVVLGAALIGGGVGGLAGFTLKKIAVKVAVRVGVGAAVGAAAGAAAGYFGYQVYGDSRDFYLSSGGDSIYMTSDLRDLYVGTYRLIVLLAVLKQYLVATNTCLYWVLNYDELALDDERGRLDSIMDHLEEKLHVRSSQVLARTSDAACIALITQLIAQNPLQEAKRHSPSDLFAGSTMANQPLAHEAAYPFLGVEKLTLVRSALCRFAGVARTLRAYLMNRYLGHLDHVGILKVMSNLDELRMCLDGLVADVLQPTVEDMDEIGHLQEEWGEEVQHLCEVACQTRAFLSHLDQEAENVIGLAQKSGVHRPI